MGRVEVIVKRVVLGAFVVAAVVCGGSKHPQMVGAIAPNRPDDVLAAKDAKNTKEGAPLRSLRPLRLKEGERIVAEVEDVARGYRFVGEATEEVSYAMPEDGVEVGNWGRRGTFGEWLRYELGWAFPLGSNDISYSSFSVFSDGRIRPTPRDRSREICAVGVPMLAMQGESRFWVASAARTNAAHPSSDFASQSSSLRSSGDTSQVTLTWENFYLNADTNAPVNAQIVLCENGDFVTRSNEVARYYARIDPDDWDGDGLANEIDAEPYTNGGDCFGTSAEWYNANCGGVLSAATNAAGEIEIGWRTNANPAAYYWLEFEATKDRTRVAVTCDGASDLGDMVVIARANEACRVPLLVGATYAVRASAPLTGIETSDENAEVTFNDDIAIQRDGAGRAASIGDSAYPPSEASPRSGCPSRGARTKAAPSRAVAWGRVSADFNIDYPLEFFFVPPPEGSGRTDYALTSTPVNVGAEISSLSGVCCTNVTAGGYFNWDCRTGCGCGGAARAVYAAVLWEGYSRSFSWWGECPCETAAEANEVHDMTQPYLVMKAPRVLYTNNDNADKGAEDEDIAPLYLEFHSPVPTNGTLRLGGASLSGGRVLAYRECNRMGCLGGVAIFDASTFTSTNLFLEGTEETVSGCISFEWLDDSGGVRLAVTNQVDIYSPDANIVNETLRDNGGICNPAAIVVGDTACFALEFLFTSPPAADIKWSIAEGVAEFIGGRTGERVRVRSDRPNQRVVLEARIGDSVSRPIQFPAYVVEPVTVKATVWIVGNDEGTYYARSAAEVEAMMPEVNKIYKQIGVSFYIDSISFTNRSEWLDLCGTNGKCDSSLRSQLVNIEQDTGGVELYFVDRISSTAIGNNTSYGAVISTNGAAHVVAHELGHAAKCKDIYRHGKHDENLRLRDGRVCREHLYDDWNNGTNHRYYSSALTQEDIIGRMLMCGIEGESGYDMPLGMAHGLDAYDNESSSIDVGFFTGGERKIPSHR